MKGDLPYDLDSLFQAVGLDLPRISRMDIKLVDANLGVDVKMRCQTQDTFHIVDSRQGGLGNDQNLGHPSQSRRHGTPDPRRTVNNDPFGLLLLGQIHGFFPYHRHELPGILLGYPQLGVDHGTKSGF